MGEREVLISPNEKAKAYLSHVSDRGFFGGKHDYYQIDVKKILPTGAEFTIRNERIEAEDVPGSVDMTDVDQHVKWSRDSTIVMYHFGDLKIRVDIPL